MTRILSYFRKVFEIIAATTEEYRYLSYTFARMERMDIKLVGKSTFIRIMIESISLLLSKLGKGMIFAV